jgi:integrase/rubredoxin
VKERKAGFHNDEHAWQSGSNNGKLAPKTPIAQSLKCPECGSQKLWKDGIRYNRTIKNTVQRWMCRNCGYRFTLWNGSDGSKPVQRVQRQNLNRNLNLLFTRQVGVSQTKAMINLVTVEPLQEKAGAGATQKPTEADVKSKLVEYAWWMNKQGYSESTIVPRCKILKMLTNRGANLFDPESIKDAIARQTWSEGMKENAVDAYSSFLLMIGGTWQPPRYKRIQKLPFVPTETEIDQLIAGCSFRTGTLLQLLKETGARPGEALRLEWTDLDPANRTVRISPEKGSNPRMFSMSTALMERLNNLPKKSLKVFGDVKHKTLQKRLQEQRRRIAAKVKNPRMLKVTFVTLRHFKATMEYHKTKDILHVMRILGHKNIKNTLVYTHLVDFKDEEFTSRAAWTLEEAC